MRPLHLFLVFFSLFSPFAFCGKLSVSSDTLLANSSTVLEVWYAINPDEAASTDQDFVPQDLLALYPNTSYNASSSSPLRYIFAETSLWTPNRRAAAEFWVPNYGSGVQLVHMRGSKIHTSNLTAAMPAAVISSRTLEYSNGNLPSQCHLTVSRRTGYAQVEVRVMWRSRQPGSSVVRYGTAPNSYSSHQYAAVSTYTAEDMCGAPASSTGFYSQQTINTAMLRGLQPSTTYFYVVGSEAFGFSPEYNFTTPPAAAAVTDASPVRLLLGADLGTFAPDAAELVSTASLELQQKLLGQLATPGSIQYSLVKASLLATGALTPAPGSRGTHRQMLQLLAAEQHHGLLLVGGLSLAVGQTAIWDDFLEQMQPIFSHVPLAAAAGDTESADKLLRGQMFDSSASGGECGTPYEQRLRMPHANRYDQWYAVDIGPLHLVMLNSDQNVTQGSPQYSFLASDLQSVNRSLTPWVIVGLHRALYVDEPSTQAPDGAAHIAQQLRQQLEPLLAEQQVDLVLNGHGRKYHHSCPVMKGVCVGRDLDGVALGPVHVMLGSAGAAIPLSGWAVQPEWLEAAVLEHSFAQLTSSRTTLELKVISSRTGEALSHLLLKKPAKWEPDAEAAQQLFANAVAPPELHGTNTSALMELLQEDVIAAALAAPLSSAPHLKDAFGPEGSLADLLSSLPLIDAPTLAQMWHVNSQLMQLVLDVMGGPAKKTGISAQPAPQPSSAPVATQHHVHEGTASATTASVAAPAPLTPIHPDAVVPVQAPAPAVNVVASPATAAAATTTTAAPPALAPAPAAALPGPTRTTSTTLLSRTPPQEAAVALPPPAASPSSSLAKSSLLAAGVTAAAAAQGSIVPAGPAAVALSPVASASADTAATPPVLPAARTANMVKAAVNPTPNSAATAPSAAVAVPDAAAALRIAAAGPSGATAAEQSVVQAAEQVVTEEVVKLPATLAPAGKKSEPVRSTLAATIFSTPVAAAADGAVDDSEAGTTAAPAGKQTIAVSKPAHVQAILAVKPKPTSIEKQAAATGVSTSKNTAQQSPTQKMPFSKKSAPAPVIGASHKTTAPKDKKRVTTTKYPAAPAMPAGPAAAHTNDDADVADDNGWVLWPSPTRRLLSSDPLVGHTLLPSMEVEYGRGAHAADALQAALQGQMADSLVLRHADGTLVTRDKVDAFVYHWLLLQGRLNFRGNDVRALDGTLV